MSSQNNWGDHKLESVILSDWLWEIKTAQYKSLHDRIIDAWIYLSHLEDCTHADAFYKIIFKKYKSNVEVGLFRAFLFLFIDATSNEQQELFCQKLQQCCILFDFMDSVSDLKSKEIKRATLNELVEYVSTNRGVIVESAYSDIVKMVSL